MNRLTSPRARRPEKARVSLVGRSPRRACRCGSDVPASGVGSSTVPTCAAAAPAASASATASAVAIPPVATSGRLVARRTAGQEIEEPRRRRGRVRERAPMPAGLAALDDERVDTGGRRLLRLRRGRDGAPDRAPGAAQRLDDLAARTAERERDDRRPLARSSSSFASQSSSLQRGSPGSTPYRSASPRSRSAYASSAPSSTRSRTGKKTLTPNGRAVRRRTSTISSATWPAVL